MNPKIISPRGLSILTFSLLFAYLLSFVFEGQVLYAIAEYFQMPSTKFIFSAIIAHFVGLFSCGFFVQTPKAAKRVMLCGIGISSACTIPFFFSAYFCGKQHLLYVHWHVGLRLRLGDSFSKAVRLKPNALKPVRMF